MWRCATFFSSVYICGGNHFQKSHQIFLGWNIIGCIFFLHDCIMMKVMICWWGWVVITWHFRKVGNRCNIRYFNIRYFCNMNRHRNTMFTVISLNINPWLSIWMFFDVVVYFCDDLINKIIMLLKQRINSTFLFLNITGGMK